MVEIVIVVLEKKMKMCKVYNNDDDNDDGQILISLLVPLAQVIYVKNDNIIVHFRNSILFFRNRYFNNSSESIQILTSKPLGTQQTFSLHFEEE